MEIIYHLKAGYSAIGQSKCEKPCEKTNGD